MVTKMAKISTEIIKQLSGVGGDIDKVKWSCNLKSSTTGDLNGDFGLYGKVQKVDKLKW